MKRSLTAGLVALMVAASVNASGGHQAPQTPGVFVPLSTFDVMAGNGSGVAEIADVSKNGRQVIYTDAENEEIGFVDISRPRAPVGTGTLSVGGEPTSLVIAGPYVLVGVNTSASFDEPSGQLLVIHRQSRDTLAVFELDGQPDSLALAPDGKRAAIVIENERDEDENDGLLPQLPSGGLKIVDLFGAPKHWQIRDADLSPAAASADNGVDLEPEYVDINAKNLAVVTFQENNHLAVVNYGDGQNHRELLSGLCRAVQCGY